VTLVTLMTMRIHERKTNEKNGQEYQHVTRLRGLIFPLTLLASYANGYDVIGKARVDYVRDEVIQSKEVVEIVSKFYFRN